MIREAQKLLNTIQPPFACDFDTSTLSTNGRPFTRSQRMRGLWVNSGPHGSLSRHCLQWPRSVKRVLVPFKVPLFLLWIRFRVGGIFDIASQC